MTAPAFDYNVEVQNFSLSNLPGFSYVRTVGSTYVRTASNILVPFAPNAPRVTSRGILIEEARINLLPYSQEFDNAAWIGTGVTFTANAGQALDSSITADKITETATTGQHRTYQSVTAVAGETYTLSVFVKSAGRTQCSLMETSAGGVVFDLTGDGAIISGTGGEIQKLASGWYRVSMTKVAVGTSFVSQIRCASGGLTDYPGDTNMGLFIWGAQLELGTFATSYIQTSSASAGRNRDAATISVGLQPNEITFMAEVEFLRTSTVGQYLASLTNNGTQERLIFVRGSAGNNISVIHTTGGVNTSPLLSSDKGGARIVKVALTRRGSTYYTAIDGVLGATFTSAVPVGLNTLHLGAISGSASPLNGFVRQVRLFNTSSTDAELIAMTA